MKDASWTILVVAVAINAASVVLLLWIRRERRRLEQMRFGVAGSAFTEAKRDVATSRLRR